jgi:hypothetical protein
MPVARTDRATGQARVVRGAEANIMRVQRGPVYVVVPVDGVDAPYHRHLDGQVGCHRRVVITVGQRHPVARRGELVFIRPAAAAIQDRAHGVIAHLGRRDRSDFRLRHLADFLAQRHAGHDGAHACLQRRIGRHGAGDARPVSQRRGAAAWAPAASSAAAIRVREQRIA